MCLNSLSVGAAAHDTTVDRSQWCLAGPFHVAETEEQARKQVEYGIEEWFDYFQYVAGATRPAFGSSCRVDRHGGPTPVERGSALVMRVPPRECKHWVLRELVARLAQSVPMEYQNENTF